MILKIRITRLLGFGFVKLGPNNPMFFHGRAAVRPLLLLLILFSFSWVGPYTDALYKQALKKVKFGKIRASTSSKWLDVVLTHLLVD